MRLAFLGTPDLAVATLAALVEAGHEIACVYSQPPARRGRGQALKPSPVHAFAEDHGLTVRTPESMRDPGVIADFQALDLDAAIVVAFGQILPAAVLDAPRLGSFNLHGSLLPRWRGAAPIQRAIMAGDAETGVQVMRMTEGLDEGPVIATARLPIAPDETAGSLHDRMAVAGAALMTASLADIETGCAAETPQVEDGATYAKKLRPKETRIDWTQPASEIDRKIRGLSPFPGAWFQLGEHRVKALLSTLAEGAGEPGEVLDAALTVACGEGAIRLLRVQREGKGAQDAEVFLRGAAVAPGTTLA
jgi:methionyl-tRNA formyltransferase